MGMHCEICGKRPVLGNQYARRGKAKYLGGVGRKVTGISRRAFRPNLHYLQVVDAQGSVQRRRVCTQCLRSGRVQRPVKNKPFQLPKF
jgi:large subunit ribosomal protein L28